MQFQSNIKVKFTLEQAKKAQRGNSFIARGEFRPRQTRQLPRAVDLKGRFLFLVVVKC
jgi:hypothetical protein